MKLIVSSDKLKVINADLVKKFWIDISQEYGYAIYADETSISYHHSLNDAKEKLDQLINTIWNMHDFVVDSKDD